MEQTMGRYCERLIYVSPEDLREKIIAVLDAAEKRATARTFPRRELDKLIEAVTSSPWGYAYGDGGAVCKRYGYFNPQTTYFACAWYTWRKQKYIAVTAYRDKAKQVRYGSSGGIKEITFEDKRTAYEMALPERYQKYRQLKIRRAIRHLPPPPPGVTITAVRPDVGGLVAADTAKHGTIVGTPVGWLSTPRANSKRPAWLILADLGFPVPRLKQKRVWNDELTAYATLFVLAGGDQA
ncbi:hypothetical protein V3F56_03530 [Moorellaceae bacterium AZ2]